MAAGEAGIKLLVRPSNPETTPVTKTTRIGDMRHVMTYTIAAGKSFNMVLSHPEESDPSTWRQETAVSDMKQHFKGWDYR